MAEHASANVPSAIAKQGDRANELMLQQQQAPQQQAPQQQVPQQQAPMVNTDPAHQQQAPQQGNFEQQYRILQGKYNKEIGELRARLADTLAIVDTVKAENLKLQGKVEALSGVQGRSGAAVEPESSNTGDSEDVILREYGQELSAGIDGRITSHLAPVMGSLQNLLAITQQSAEERFFDSLDVLCPSWENINKSPDFIAWLAETAPPGSGDNFKELLNRAFKSHNALKVSEIFNLFAGNAHSQPLSSGMHQQVVPGRGLGAVGVGGVEPVTREEIRLFYDAVQRSPGQFTPAQVTAFEQKVQAANAAGVLR